jgi:hypothetical protein
MGTPKRQDGRQPKRGKTSPRKKAPRKKAAGAKGPWSVERLEGGQDPLDWPVVRAWAPWRDAWAATANGTAAILRRRPDGGEAFAFFTLSMMEDGLTTAADKLDAAPGEFEKLLKQLGDSVPPFEEARPDVASAFVWGGYAAAIEAGLQWDRVPGIKQALALVAKPPGKPHTWADMMWEDSISEDLQQVILSSPGPDEVPEGKEVMILTTATFDIDDPARAAEVLRAAAPEVVHDGRRGDAELFSLTREYPKRHWSPLAKLGGRQVIAHVEVSLNASEPYLIVEGKTLSMTCVVMQRLRVLLGDGTFRLADVEWTTAEDLARLGKRPELDETR